MVDTLEFIILGINSTVNLGCTLYSISLWVEILQLRWGRHFTGHQFVTLGSTLYGSSIWEVVVQFF